MIVPSIPRPSLVIVTCMDARVDPHRALGLDHGAAHVLRNAGAVVTEDVVRSLVLSQRLLGTRSVAVMAHTDCALSKLRERDFARGLQMDTGESPPFAFGSFADVDEHVRDQMMRVRACRWLPHVDDVRGYVLRVEDNHVRPVSAATYE